MKELTRSVQQLTGGVFVCVYECVQKPHLSSVGQEQRRRQVTSDTTEHVDDGDTDPTSQLLQVPQDGHLKHH